MGAGGSDLWVVMPVYNEAGAIRAVVEEWLAVLRSGAVPFRLCVIDDGSTDATPAMLAELARAHPEVEVVTKTNTGHGRTCLHGYRLAIARGARWVLQIDSDGQCDAAHFSELWRLRTAHPLVFGARRVRRDGWWRQSVSWMLALGAAAAAGVWVRDPNTPYRLMRTNVLGQVLDAIPQDVDLANVYLAMVLEMRAPIRWVPIVFRERLAGRSRRRPWAMVRPGLGVIMRLAWDRRRLRGDRREAVRRQHLGQ
jgi:glycosyltransferase involved in cell wall biosynthesis